MTQAVYVARAHVTGGRDGHGRSDDGKLDVPLRMPPELGGDGAGTNPEQLFAVGFASCFATVLTSLGRRGRLAVADVAVDCAVSLVPVGDGTFVLSARFDIALPHLGDGEIAAGLVRQAHKICPYSRAVSGNVEVAMRVNGIEV